MNYDAIVSIADTLTAHMTPDDSFRVLSEILHEVTGIDRASLTLYDAVEDNFSLVATAVDNVTKAPKEFRLPRHGSRVGAAHELGKPVLAVDLAGSQAFPEDVHLAKAGMKQGLNLPIMVDGASVGTLNVNWKQDGQITDEQVELFKDITAVLARNSTIAWWKRGGAQTSHDHVVEAESLVLRRPSLKAQIGRLKKYAVSGASVVIHGETGTGKGILARALHGWSRRHNEAFVKCDCAALTDSLIESELFGHEKGAFTGAAEQRLGRFELANRGTVFLDEIGELPLESQPKLLGAIEEQQIIRLGGVRPVDLDFRLISATNRELKHDVSERKFRSDLYHRLCVIELDLPPLRDCPEDIEVLASYFIQQISKRLGKNTPVLDPVGLKTLQAYHWPGNVREFNNVMERALLLSEGRTVQIDSDLLAGSLNPVSAIDTPNGFRSLADVEADYIIKVLSSRRWQINGEAGAAKVLDMHPNTLRSRMKVLGIKRPVA